MFFIRRVLEGGALRRGTMEQISRLRHHHQSDGRPTAGRETEYRDIARVAAECCDVVADPLQCRDLIQQAKVARNSRVYLKWRKSEDAESIVDGHHHHVLVQRERAPVESGTAAGAVREGSAVDVKQNRPPRTIERRSPDIEVQTILTLRKSRDSCAVVILWSDGASGKRISHTGP